MVVDLDVARLGCVHVLMGLLFSWVRWTTLSGRRDIARRVSAGCAG